MSRPRRGRPRKVHDDAERRELPDIVQPRRSSRLGLRSETLQEKPEGDRPPPQSASEEAVKGYQSAIASHLAENVDCRLAYRDDCFTVLSRARCKKYLDVYESVCIQLSQPVLCIQKKFVTQLHLYKSSLTSS